MLRDVVVRELGVVDAEDDEVGGRDLLDRAVDAGERRTERVGGDVRVVRAWTSAPSARSCSAMSMAGDSRQSLVPGLYARPSSRMREPLTDRFSLFRSAMTRLTTYSGMPRLTSFASSTKRKRCPS